MLCFLNFLPFLEYPKDESLNIKDFPFNIFFGIGKIQGTTCVEKVQISGIPWQSSSQDSALSWLRTQVQFLVRTRKKKEKMQVSVKFKYKKPSLQILFEILFLQGLGIVSIK